MPPFDLSPALGPDDALNSGHYQLRDSLQESIPDLKSVSAALDGDAVARRVLAKGYRMADGELCGVRLNLNVLKTTGVAVHSIHAPSNGNGGHRANRGFWRGAVLTYRPVVVMRDAYFNVCQRGREQIACGGSSKFPMASVDGVFAEEFPSLDGIAIRFNPRREHLFVDPDGRAIQWAEHVTLAGPLVVVRGRVRYYTERTAPPRAGNAPSQVRFD